jgi:hypothetical protein
MKKTMILLGLMTSISMVSYAQTWQETWTQMSIEERMMKLRTFRDENQKFLKDSLGMTSNQLKSIDSVNSIFLNGLKKLEGSTASDDEKLAKAKEIAKKRGEDLDMIMGEQKHHRFTQYLYEKLQKAQG